MDLEDYIVWALAWTPFVVVLAVFAHGLWKLRKLRKEMKENNRLFMEEMEGLIRMATTPKPATPCYCSSKSVCTH